MAYRLPYNTHVIVGDSESAELIKADEIEKNCKLYTKNGWKKVKNVELFESEELYLFSSEYGDLYTFENEIDPIPFIYYVDIDTYDLVNCFYKYKDCEKKNSLYDNIDPELADQFKIVIKTCLFVNRNLMKEAIFVVIQHYGHVYEGHLVFPKVDKELSSSIRTALSFFGIQCIYKHSNLYVYKNIEKDFSFKIGKNELTYKTIFGIIVDIDTNCLWNDGFCI